MSRGVPEHASFSAGSIVTQDQELAPVHTLFGQHISLPAIATLVESDGAKLSKVWEAGLR